MLFGGNVNVNSDTALPGVVRSMPRNAFAMTVDINHTR